MPTSLTYFIPLARGFSPWRPDAVMSTDRRKVTKKRMGSRQGANPIRLFCNEFCPCRRRWLFHGTAGAHRTPLKKVRRYAGHPTLSPGDPIPGSLVRPHTPMHTTAAFDHHWQCTTGAQERPSSRTENPSQGPRHRVPTRLRCRSALAPRFIRRLMPQPPSWPRNINLVPFR